MKPRICVLVTGDDRDTIQPLEEAAAAAGYRTILAHDPKEAAQVLTGGFAGMTLADLERQAILDTLRACRGNKAATARALGVCEKTIYNKLKRLRTFP